MSHDDFHDDDTDAIILKPKPRRPFELSSPPPSGPTTPTEQSPSSLPPYLQPQPPMEGSSTPSRTRSFLNLTSSTLFGIYQPTGYNTERDEATTPWGTGAQTPAESPISRQNSLDWSRGSIPDSVLHNGPNGMSMKSRRRSVAPPQQRPHQMPRRGFTGYVLPTVGRVVTLFAIGVLYALLITHLHDHRELAPVRVELNRGSWVYLACWGVGGVLLGEALPWMDTFWMDEDEDAVQRQAVKNRNSAKGLDGWLDVVRSIGAFVGIAFAIRKLPWQSSLQLSLTLALANPAVWYLIDRSPPGFIVASCAAIGGTIVLLGVNPALVPSPTPAQVLRNLIARHGGAYGSASALPSDELVLGIFSQESIGVATWIASVFFVSAVCFGNIGRRLAPQRA